MIDAVFELEADPVREPVRWILDTRQPHQRRRADSHPAGRDEQHVQHGDAGSGDAGHSGDNDDSGDARHTAVEQHDADHSPEFDLGGEQHKPVRRRFAQRTLSCGGGTDS